MTGSSLFIVFIFIVSGIEKKFQMCYSKITKGNRKRLTLKQFFCLTFYKVSRQLFAVVGGYFLLSS